MKTIQEQQTRIWNGKEFISPTNNLEAFNALNGQQGGTIHQLAHFYRATVSDILNLDFNWTLDLLGSMNTSRIAEPKTMELARKYYNRPGVSLQEVANMLVGLKLQNRI